MEAKKRIKKYKTQSVHYFENALHFIETGDAEKASEFLWGSIAQAVKAVVAIKGITFRGHRQLRNYAEGLSKELNDKSIYDHFLHAESLHTNFYECELELKDVIRVAEEVKITVGTLLSNLPEEIHDKE